MGREKDGVYLRSGIDTRTIAERTGKDGVVAPVDPIRQTWPTPRTMEDGRRAVVRPSWARSDLQAGAGAVEGVGPGPSAAGSAETLQEPTEADD